MPSLDRHDNVFVLDLGDGENRFHPDWLTAVSAALDEVEKAEGPRALVTAATGKFYSNGLDLDWLFAHADEYHDYVVSVHELFARMLSLPVISGRAAGTHLRRRRDVLPRPRLPRDARRPRLLVPARSGHQHPLHPRHGRPHPVPPDAADRSRGHGHRPPLRRLRRRCHRHRRPSVPEDAVRSTAVQIAQAQVAKAGDTLGTIKARMYAPALATLRDTTDPLG